MRLIHAGEGFIASLALLWPLPAMSAFVSLSGSWGPLSAQVTFSQAATGAPVIVQLVNTGLADARAPTDVLTGVFFSLTGSPVLTPASAVLGAGSSVVYHPHWQPVGGIVGGEWAYRSGLSGAPRGVTSGISSARFGRFGRRDLFPGPDLTSRVSPAGIDFGLLPAGDNVATGRKRLKRAGGQVKNSAVFTLDAPTGYALTGVSRVSFQYGPSLRGPNISAVLEPSVAPVSEPAALGLLCGGVALLALVAARRAR